MFNLPTIQQVNMGKEIDFSKLGTVVLALWLNVNT